MLNTFKEKFLYYFLQFTWGIEANLIGLVAFLICRFILGWEVSKYHKNIVVSPKDIEMNAGLSLGIFLFMDKDASESTKQHEYGHSIQNLIFGVLWFELIAIWSFIRFWYYTLMIDVLKLNINYNYYSIWFERDASALGKRAIKEKAWDWII